MRQLICVVVWLANSVVVLGDSPQKPLVSPFGKRCGFLCMATVCGVLNEPLRYKELAQQLPNSESGSSLGELSQAALSLGFSPLSVRYSDALPDFVPGECCAIVPVRAKGGDDHFVVVVNSSRGIVSLVDFPNGMIRLTEQSLRHEYAWDGTALLIAKSSPQLDRLTQKSNRFWLWAGGSSLCFAVVVFSIVSRTWRGHAM